MNQLAIDFTVHTHFRKSDPETSKQAAARAEKFARGHAATILDCLKDYGPQTIDEISRRTGLSSVQVARRTPELQKAGMARPTGRTRLSASGCAEREWGAV